LLGPETGAIIQKLPMYFAKNNIQPNGVQNRIERMPFTGGEGIVWNSL
jgi:hypothetical protein